MFIDSVVWIAAKLKRDQWHEKAKKIIQKFLSREIKIVYVNDYIILETVNFLLRKAGFDVALETLNIFRTHKRIRIININSKIFEEACKIFMKYIDLSLTDASIIATMQQLGIKQLYSFDSGFDKVKWIKRLEN